MALRAKITRRDLLLTTSAAPLLGQKIVEPEEKPVEFICPMDPEVRAKVPGRCPRCGMKLIAGLPDGREFHLHVTPAAKPIRAGELTKLKLEVIDPKTSKPIRDFEVVHEKLFHLFIVNQDLSVFAHEHPVKTSGPQFEFEWKFPKPGMYRLMTDYYPLNATPQLTVQTLFVADGPGSPIIQPESNTKLKLQTEPEKPLAGMKTKLYFTLDPAGGWVPWLGAWAHMLAASSDLIDIIHTHPFLADGHARMQFNVIFPRPGKHRLWVQFDRKNVVNTASFDLDVGAL